MTIGVRYDRQRGCGWRKPGGLYLVSPGPGRRCGVLPILLERCPVCSHGIKPSRGWTWIDVAPIIPRHDAGGVRCEAPADFCSRCPFPKEGRHGLLWIGGAYYPTPREWLNEATTMGVSRRISALPKGFDLGRTWVLVAHRHAVPDPSVTPGAPEQPYLPGIFHAFLPQAVEYVVRGTESDDAIEALEARGITPVRVERLSDAPELPLERVTP